jgi:hypothetical protein
MGATHTEKLRNAAEGLILTDAQKHILAHRLARKLASKGQGSITVPEMLGLIENAMCDMQPGVDVEMLVISEDAYRDNRVIRHA